MKCLLVMLFGALCWSAVAADPTAGLGSLERIGVDRGCRAAVEGDGVLVLRREIPINSPAVRTAARLLLKDPVDLSGKAIEFELRGDPGADRIQVSFNNRGSRIPVLRGDGGKGTLSATEWRRFRLEKGAADGLRFDRRGVDGGDPDRVDQALFAMFHSAPRPGEVRLEMRNLRIVPARGTPAGLPEGPDPFSALGGLKNVILAPGVTRSIAPDGALSLRGNIVMHERNSAEKKCSLRLKKNGRPLGQGPAVRSPDAERQAGHALHAVFQCRETQSLVGLLQLRIPGRKRVDAVRDPAAVFASAQLAPRVGR